MNNSSTRLSGAECNGNWSLTLKKETTLNFWGNIVLRKILQTKKEEVKKRLQKTT